jgi:hypothetical protein
MNIDRASCRLPTRLSSRRWKECQAAERSPMSNPFRDTDPAPAADPAATREDRVAQARSDAAFGVSDLAEALSALEHALRAARMALDADPAVSAADLRAEWRGSNALLQQAVAVAKARAATLCDAVRVLLTA